MAHRGPLRELYVGLSMMMLVEKVQKNITPPTSTGFVVDAEDDFILAINTTALPNVHTSPAKGFLSLLFAFLVPDFAGIAEDILTMVAMEVLAYCFLPAMLIIKRFLILGVELARRQLREPLYSGETRQNARIAQDLADQVFSLTKVSAIHTSTISSLDQLLGESERKVVNITRDSDDKSARLTGEKVSLHASLRRIVDPDKVHPSSKSTVSLVQDLEDRYRKAAKDLKRANRDIEEVNKAIDDGQLAQKEQRISELNNTKATLSQRVDDLEQRLGEVVEEAKEEKEAAIKEQKKLQKRLSDAERTAREGRSKRDYGLLRDQLDGVVVDLGTTQQALRDEENKTRGLQANAVNEENARRESESQLTTARNDLQLANDKIANFKRQASTQSEEVQDAKELEAEKRKTLAAEKEAEAAKKATEAAEEKVRVAEAKSTENATTASELQHSLQGAEDQARELHESNELLKLQVQSGETNPETTENVSNDNLVTEISNLRAQLNKSNQQAELAFNAGYQQAIHSNPQPSVNDQIQEALTNERSQAQLALRDAEARTEEAVRQEVGRRWVIESAKNEENARQAAAEIERLNVLGRGVEQRLSNTQAELNEAVQRRAESQAEVERQVNELRRLQGQNDSLTADQSVYNKNIKDLGNLYREANAKLNTAKEELAAGKKDLLNAKAADQVEEIETIERDLERARELMEEIADTPMDENAHCVFQELTSLNSAITVAKLTLEASGPKVDVKAILKALEGNHVEEDLLNDLSLAERPVLINQSRMANELLSALMQKLTSEKNVRRDALLARVNRPRGDEASLKRKMGDVEADAPNKRQDTSNMGMGFGLGCSHQQGSSSLTTSSATDSQGADTLLTSQHECPPPERNGEATPPQVQIPAIWSAASSQFDPYFHPKPTMIPGPKPKAHLTPSERQEKLAIRDYQEKNAAPAQNSVPFAGEGSTEFSFSLPKNISSADIVKPTPAQPSHNRIFHGLSVLGAAMADKSSALPGLPPPEQDDVIDFGSSTMEEDHESTSEVDDGFRAHTVSDDEEDEETIWEDALYPKEPDDHLDLDLRAYRSTNNDDDDWPSTIRALDMTEQNYEEQAAEVAAGTKGVQAAPPRKASDRTRRRKTTSTSTLTLTNHVALIIIK